MTTVTVQDLRALKYCVPGSRQFCERYGLDWKRLVREGLQAEELAHIDDAMVSRLIEQARKREGVADGQQ